LSKPEFAHIFILIDDTYHELSFAEESHFFLNIAGVEKFKSRVAVSGGLSKCLGGSPALRAGFLYACDIHVGGETISLTKRSEVAMLNTTCAVTSIVAYSLQEVLKAKRKIGRSNADQELNAKWEKYASDVYSNQLALARKKFSSTSHFPLVVNPEGTFFAMLCAAGLFGFPVPDSVVQINGTEIAGLRQKVKTDVIKTDLHVAMLLLHGAYVALVPASDFGCSPSDGYLRISCSVSPQELEEAFERIEHVAKQVTRGK